MQSPTALQLRYLQTLTTIASEKNSTIVFPIPVMGMISGLHVTPHSETQLWTLFERNSFIDHKEAHWFIIWWRILIFPSLLGRINASGYWNISDDIVVSSSSNLCELDTHLFSVCQSMIYLIKTKKEDNIVIWVFLFFLKESKSGCYRWDRQIDMHKYTHTFE